MAWVKTFGGYGSFREVDLVVSCGTLLGIVFGLYGPSRIANNEKTCYAIIGNPQATILSHYFSKAIAYIKVFTWRYVFPQFGRY